MAHPPRIPVLLPQEISIIYFVTICVENRQRVLDNSKAMNAFYVAINRLQRWMIHAAVLMPDHIHLLASPHERNESVSHLSGALKRWIRHELKASWQWQAGSFDRLLRKEERIEDKWNYMRENPVRAALVKHGVDWPYCMGLGEKGKIWQAERLPTKE